ncbi:MAG: hypothetical protein ACTHOB_08615 [Ginsengibacter sp.]
MKPAKSRNTDQAVSSTKRGLQEGYDRVTFIVKEETAYKLNCIASIEDVFLKEVVNEALEKYVFAWEKSNSKIAKKKKK